MDSVYVLDSFALLAHFEGEKRGEKVTSLLKKAQSGNVSILFSVINLGEVYYITMRERGEKKAERVLTFMEILPIKIIEANLELTIEASKLKSKYPVAYADCFAVSLAVKAGAKVLTGDPEFKHMEKEVRIEWI